MIKEAHDLGKIIAVPVCRQDKTLVSCKLSKKTKLIKGPYAVHQPVIKRCINLKNIDLVIVPGLAFTNKGERLGRGKGYYDRFLATVSSKTRSLGLAYDFQILPSIPTTATDVNVDRVIFA
jgi:5-formyltetrahydrofolate cyclo-ligase